MFFTHSEYYHLPNTPDGQELAEALADAFRKLGNEPSVETTTTSISVCYSNLIQVGEEVK